MEVRKEINDRLTELNEIVKKYPHYIPVNVAAKYIGANAEGLRESIFKGQCPWAIAWQKDIAGNRAFKIPTLKFYLWFSNNAGI